MTTTRKYGTADAYDSAADKLYATEMVSNASPKMTSVNAHTALTIVVSMSVVEMERLIESFGVADVNLDDTARVLQREFADAVRSLR